MPCDEADIADANRIRLSYVEEECFGETPATPTLTDIRFVSESLNQTQTTEDSKEIRDDRQTSDIVRTKVSSQGDIGIEMSYGAHDDFWAALFCSAGWSAPVTITAATISASAVDNSFNDSGNGLGSLVANQWVKTAGFADPANNGFFKIVSKTTAKIVVKGRSVVTEAASTGNSITMGAQIVNGLAKRSFTIERQYTDLTNEYVDFKGMMINTGNVAVKADAIMTGTFGWLGKREVPGTASLGTGYAAAATNDVMAGVSDVFAVMQGLGSNLAAVTDVANFDFSYNNNLRERMRVGTLGAFSLGTGTIGIEGSLNMYFTSGAMRQQFLDFSEVAFATVLQDALGHAYVVDFPSVKFSAGPANAGGINTDIMSDMKFRAKRNPTEGITARMVRFS